MKIRNVRSNKPNGAFNFAVCFDGAENSIIGFDTVFKVMDKTKDTVEVVTVVKADMNLEKI